MKIKINEEELRESVTERLKEEQQKEDQITFKVANLFLKIFVFGVVAIWIGSLFIDATPWSIAHYKEYRNETGRGILSQAVNEQYDARHFKIFNDCVAEDAKNQGIVGTPPPANASILERIKGITYPNIPQMDAIYVECKKFANKDIVPMTPERIAELREQVQNRSTVVMYVSFIKHLVQGDQK